MAFRTQRAQSLAYVETNEAARHVALKAFRERGAVAIRSIAIKALRIACAPGEPRNRRKDQYPFHKALLRP
jgi:hypothetical protein